MDAKQIKRQATIKRYGWSNISLEDALRHAKQRVIEAHQRWMAGEDIHRLERKELYNTELVLAEFSWHKAALDTDEASGSKQAIEDFVRWHDGACQVDLDLPLA